MTSKKEKSVLYYRRQPRGTNKVAKTEDEMHQDPCFSRPNRRDKRKHVLKRDKEGKEGQAEQWE